MRVRGGGNGTAGEEGGLSVAMRVTWIACIAMGLTEAPDREQLKMRLCGAGCIPGAVWRRGSGYVALSASGASSPYISKC